MVFSVADPVTDPRTAFPCSGGETQALMRLQYYFWDTVTLIFPRLHPPTCTYGCASG